MCVCVCVCVCVCDQLKAINLHVCTYLLARVKRREGGEGRGRESERGKERERGRGRGRRRPYSFEHEILVVPEWMRGLDLSRVVFVTDSVSGESIHLSFNVTVRVLPRQEQP